MSHSAGTINTGQMVIEQGTNAYSMFGGVYGAAWGIGWEMGRSISTTSGWQNLRDNKIVPGVGKVIDWFR
ncbi:hypothetical protein [Sphingobacterium sp. LRF_L2]|uniref:hypothetical protein n=1 Tax=Sphingobacterium sp. LRF_L2 TaxID=3369421 RepID=UPI003F60421C